MGILRKSIAAAACILAVASFQLHAVDTTEVYFGPTLHIRVPNDLLPIVNENKSAITNALISNGVTQGQLDSIQTEITTSYDNFRASSSFSTTSPFTTAVDGLNDFCRDLGDSIPNAQTLQNVWAPSWIGPLVPGAHFGFGLNAGVSSMDISSLKKTAKAMSLDTGGLGDKLVFPIVTADARLGGIKLPFDVGFTFSTIDSAKIGALDSAIDPVSFNFFSIGGDIRYCVFQCEERIKVSVSTGGYFTKGGVSVEKDGSGVDMDFRTRMLFIGAQANTRFLCFVPFIGTRVTFDQTDVNWKVKADWTKILDQSNSYIKDAISWGILPSNFSSDIETDWKVRPQVYGGIGLDLFCVDLTASASYDFMSQVAGGAFSVRFAR